MKLYRENGTWFYPLGAAGERLGTVTSPRATEAARVRPGNSFTTLLGPSLALALAILDWYMYVYIVRLAALDEPRPVDIMMVPFFHIPLLFTCSMHVYIQFVR